MQKMIISTLILIVVGLFIFGSKRKFIPLPIGIRHFVNLAQAPNKLYQPIILDKYLFFQKGFTKTYYLKPIYLDIYEIGFFIDRTGIESSYKFKGKLKAEFYWKNEFQFSSVITSMDQAWYRQNDMGHYKQISLYKFDIPLQKKYLEDISVRITVIEPDQALEKYSDSINLYIAVTGAP